jgi:hypothetical protein
MKPTRLGVCLMEASKTRRYSWFNDYAERGVHRDEINVYEKVIPIKKTKINFFTILFY